RAVERVLQVDERLELRADDGRARALEQLALAAVEVAHAAQDDALGLDRAAEAGVPHAAGGGQRHAAEEAGLRRLGRVEVAVRVAVPSLAATSRATASAPRALSGVRSLVRHSSPVTAAEAITDPSTAAPASRRRR